MQDQALIQGRSASVPLRILILIAALLLIGAASVSGCGSNDEPADLKGITRQPPTKVGSVSLPNDNPVTRTSLNQLRGTGDGFMLVYFGYTYCPDVCPTTFADLRLAMSELSPEQRRRLSVGMVTVDPGRDSGKVLNEYLGHFFPAGSFASFRPRSTGSLASAEDQFGASSSVSKPHKDGTYDVDHSAQVYAVNSRGVVPVEWTFGTSWEDIASDLKSLLDESPSAAS